MMTLTRKELAQKSPRDFKHGDKIRVGKYLIFVKQASWGTGNHATYAESDDNPMLPLTASKMPRYIREFVLER